MKKNPNITTAELHAILGVSETAVEKNISFLKENGYNERVGQRRQGIGECCKDYNMDLRVEFKASILDG